MQTDIRQAIQAIVIADTNITLSSVAKITQFNQNDNHLAITLVFDLPIATLRETIKTQLTNTIAAIAPKLRCDMTLQQTIKAHQVQGNVSRMKTIKNIIAIGSGKGGVGKSTTTVNLACALAKLGATVGILDADIYGPNQPAMLGVRELAPPPANKKLQPVFAHGIYSMSIGYLIEQNDTPMIWRGPMVSSALQQLLNETEWPELDYLLIDLPPGTGDIQLTMAQKIPVTAAIVCSTPQDIALLDAKKAQQMFKKVNIPVLGVIENMASYHCPNCGHQDPIFGSNGAKQMAAEYGIDWLGDIPLNTTIRTLADTGSPMVVTQPDHAISQQYLAICLKWCANLCQLPKAFPTIVTRER